MVSWTFEFAKSLYTMYVEVNEVNDKKSEPTDEKSTQLIKPLIDVSGKRF